MSMKIALAGNPNCGKTTLFNALTGANQYVGNWPGVTVEKKEGKWKKDQSVIITDLPGIYSLSPYTLEEVVARNYLVEERPDAILNIVDGTNLERNLYLTTQLLELGIPVAVAVNMMDIVEKSGDKINTEELSRELGCKITEISALKGIGVLEAAEAAVKAAKEERRAPGHNFSGPVEHAIAHIEEAAVHGLPEEQQRWYAVKIFERDEQVLKKLRGERDTKVKLGIKRPTSKKTLKFDVTRGDIPVTSIDAAYIVNPGIGYIKVNKFGRTTYDEFWQSLNDLKRDGAQDFIIDLRGNTGGFMEIAFMMANEFLEKVRQ